MLRLWVIAELPSRIFPQKYDSVNGKLVVPGRGGRPRCTTAEHDAAVVEYFEEKRSNATVRQAAVDLRIPESTVWSRFRGKQEPPRACCT